MARREFVYVDECADALASFSIVFLPEIVNIGSGEDVAISESAQLVAEVTGFQGVSCSIRRNRRRAA